MARTTGKDRDAIRAIQALRDKSGLSAQRLALELYESSGRRSTIETYQRRFGGCFNAERDQDAFEFWEVVAMMKFTKVYDPLFYICDLLGFRRPERLDMQEQAFVIRAKLEAAREEVAMLEQELEKLPQTFAEKDKLVRFTRDQSHGEQ